MRVSSNYNALRSLTDFALNRSRAVAQTLQTTFVYRPGEPNPSGCVYNDFQLLYAQYSNLQNASVQGPKVIQIDDTLVSPAVIPAGIYTIPNTSVVGIFRGNDNTECELADGVVLDGLATVGNKLTLRSKSTTVPVRTLGSTDLVLIERGSNCQNDPTSTVPFFHVPSGLADPPVVAAFTGGEMGTPGNRCLSIEAGAGAIVLLDALAAFANDIVTGLGSLTVVVTSQSAFLNTPFPILQPAVGALTTFIFDFANFVGFQNLNSGNWNSPPPTNVEEAINRMASLLQTLNGGVPIP